MGSSRLCCFAGLFPAPQQPAAPKGCKSASRRTSRTEEPKAGSLGDPPPGLPPLEVDTHISGTASRVPLSSEAVGSAGAVRTTLDSEGAALLKRHAHWCTDATIVRFLIARDWNTEAAAKLLKEALRWRDHRRPDWVLSDPKSEVTKRFRKEAETGKIRVAGRDRHGRAVMTFDNSVENTKDDEWHLNFVSWSTMLALRTCAPGVDKICLVLNLDRFSMFNNPPLWVTRETITMLTKGFPETLGTCILYQPPAAFMKLYGMIKYLIDPKPRSKFHFIKGDCSPGSENDCKLRYLIGDDWRALTGCGLQPLERRYSEFHGREIQSSPGFLFEEYWADILSREKAYADAHPELFEEADDANGEPEPPLKSAKAEKGGQTKGDPLRGIVLGVCTGLLLTAVVMTISVYSGRS